VLSKPQKRTNPEFSTAFTCRTIGCTSPSWCCRRAECRPADESPGGWAGRDALTTAFYFCSTGAKAGKTTVALALAHLLREQKFSVGYFKPIGTLGANGTDPDATAAHESLQLRQSIEQISPLRSDSFEATRVSQTVLLEAYQAIASASDVLLVEGPPQLQSGEKLGYSAGKLAELCSAQPILVTAFRREHLLQNVRAVRQAFGGRELGLVLNRVLPHAWLYIEKVLQPALLREGVVLLSALPWEPLLTAASLSEVVSAYDGQVLCAQERCTDEELVEQVVIGAMGSWDHNKYFRSHPNSVIVTKASRPDIALAALGSPTKAVVLTGPGQVDPSVLRTATMRKIPLIRVGLETMEAVDAIQRLFTNPSVRYPQKIQKAAELLKARLDFPKFQQWAGLRQQALLS
ncbi:MAG: phosphotransacetylase family protein, partial [Chloroflexi bacterium]|nr:phosphotransacetylase family protein [Chloroflexota bacterium]